MLPVAARPITVADYGCSEGSNSLLAIDHAVAKLCARGAVVPICAIFNDIASNNFNRLFENLSQTAHLTIDRPDFFPSAVPGTFYGPLLPAASVDLAVSFNSVLWLEHPPEAIVDDFIVYPGPRSHRADVAISDVVRSTLARQSGDDLRRFLEHCARDCAPAAG